MSLRAAPLLLPRALPSRKFSRGAGSMSGGRVSTPQASRKPGALSPSPSGKLPAFPLDALSRPRLYSEPWAPAPASLRLSFGRAWIETMRQFPAYAGVFPLSHCLKDGARAIPRIRGGVSEGSCIAFMPYLPRVCGVCRPHGGGSLCTFRRGGFFVSAARPLILLPPLPSGNSQRVRVPVVRHGRKGRGCLRVRGVNRVPPAAFIAPSGNRTTAAETLPGIPENDVPVVHVFG